MTYCFRARLHETASETALKSQAALKSCSVYMTISLRQRANDGFYF